MVGEGMDLVLHMCCAPCTTYSQARFRDKGYTLHGFFYNPNIHPYTEYRQRKNTLVEYCRQEGIPLYAEVHYNVEEFLRGALAEKNRCAFCYRLRLEKAALYAAEKNIPFFSTTLLISPYQDHELLRKTGEEAADRHGVTFIYEDLRPGFRQSVEEAKRLGLYRQKYCGCIFSEQERFYRKKRKGGL